MLTLDTNSINHNVLLQGHQKTHPLYEGNVSLYLQHGPKRTVF